jgi:hypothetical protein
MSKLHRRRQLDRRRRRPAVEGLEPRISPTPAMPGGSVLSGKTSPSKPIPVEPKSPAVPKGDGTPPIAGPSVPGGTTEPA